MSVLYFLLCLSVTHDLTCYSYENAKKLLLPELLHLAQICTKSFVGCGFAPDPTGGAYSAPPDPIAGLDVGPQGKAEGGRGGRIWGKGEGRWRMDCFALAGCH